jgi:ComF family protein
MPLPLNPALERQLFADAPARMPFLRDSVVAALDLLFPPHCAACDMPLLSSGNKALCRDCAQRLTWIGADRCARCGDRTGIGSGVTTDCMACRTHPPAHVSASCTLMKFHDGSARALLLSLKFGKKLHLAKMYGDLLAARVRETGMYEPDMIVVPAPVTRATLRSRSFNQAEEIAECVAKSLNLRVESRLLKKIRQTTPQAKVKILEERRKNLKGAFACDAKIAARCKDAVVLLIDDVITTGTTVSECARTLVAAGFGDVRAAAVARA